MDNLMHLITKK